MPQDAADDADISDALQDVIEGQIIPRLLMVYHQDAGGAPGETDGDRRETALSDGLSPLDRIVASAISGGPTDVRATIDERFRGGAGIREVLLELLAPAAQRLGVMWERDEISFVEVTIALGRLQSAVVGLYRPHTGDSEAADEREVLLLIAPGDSHSFGVNILAELFRSNDWRVIIGEPKSLLDVAELVHATDCGVVGFSLSSVVLLDELKRAIAAARSVAVDRDLHVMVGGYVFQGYPQRADDVGADSAPQSPDDAVAIAAAHRMRRRTGVRH